MNPFTANDTRIAVNYGTNVSGLYQSYEPCKNNPNDPMKITFSVNHSHPNFSTKSLQSQSTTELTQSAISLLGDVTSFCAQMKNPSTSSELLGLGMQHATADKITFLRTVQELKHKDAETAQLLLHNFNSIDCVKQSDSDNQN